MAVVLTLLVGFFGWGIGMASIAAGRRQLPIARAHASDRPSTSVARAEVDSTVEIEGTVAALDDVRVPSTAERAACVLGMVLRPDDNVGFSYTTRATRQWGETLAIDDATGRAIVELGAATIVAPAKDHRGPPESWPESARALVPTATAHVDFFRELTVVAGARARARGRVLSRGEEAGETDAYRASSGRPAIRLGGPVTLVAYDLEAMRARGRRAVITGVALMASGPAIWAVLSAAGLLD